jgi:hypothetical protein
VHWYQVTDSSTELNLYKFSLLYGQVHNSLPLVCVMGQMSPVTILMLYSLNPFRATLSLLSLHWCWMQFCGGTWRNGDIVPLILNLSTTWEWVVSFMPLVATEHVVGWAAEWDWAQWTEKYKILDPARNQTMLPCTYYTKHDWGSVFSWNNRKNVYHMAQKPKIRPSTDQKLYFIVCVR